MFSERDSECIVLVRADLSRLLCLPASTSTASRYRFLIYAHHLAVLRSRPQTAVQWMGDIDL